MPIFGLTRCSFMESGPSLPQNIPVITNCKECCQYIPKGEKTTQCQIITNNAPIIYRCYLETDDAGHEICKCLETKTPGVLGS